MTKNLEKSANDLGCKLTTMMRQSTVYVNPVDFIQLLTTWSNKNLQRITGISSVYTHILQIYSMKFMKVYSTFQTILQIFLTGPFQHFVLLLKPFLYCTHLKRNSFDEIYVVTLFLLLCSFSVQMFDVLRSVLSAYYLC